MCLCIIITSSLPSLHSTLLFEYSTLSILLLSLGILPSHTLRTNAAMTILTQASGPPVQVSLQGLHLGLELLGCQVCSFSRLDSAKLFSKMVVPVYTPTSSMQGSFA